MIKNISPITIDSIEAKKLAIKECSQLDTDAVWTVFFEKEEQKHTTLQRRKFFAMLNEYVELLQLNELLDVNQRSKGYQEWFVKYSACYFDTKSGELLPDFEDKEALVKWYFKYLTNTTKKTVSKLPNDILIELAEASFKKSKAMGVKSIKDATKQEISKLIDTLISVIVENLPQDIILSSETLAKDITEQYNSLIESGNINTDKELLFQKLNDKLSWACCKDKDGKDIYFLEKEK